MSVTRSMTRPAIRVVTRAMASRGRRSRGASGRCPSKCRGIETGPLSRRSSRSIRHASPALTRTSFRCMRGGSRPARSSNTWKRSTTWKNRGVTDIFIACVDGLKGFPEAIESVFPQTEVQLCIVHLVRHSLNYVGWKQRKEVAADLKRIYSAATEAEAEQKLAEFSLKWDTKFPTIAKSWRSNWGRVIPFFAHPPEIRKVIYTTNAIESLNMSLRKVTKARGSFPNDEAVFKLLYLALRNIAKKWTMPIRDWKAPLNRFAIVYENRLPVD